MKNKHLLSYLSELFMALLRLSAWTVRQGLRLIAYVATQCELFLRNLMD